MTHWRQVRRAAADFWLNLMFALALYCPVVVATVRSFFLWWAWCFSPGLRNGPIRNARWLLGEASSRRQRVKLAKSVINHFYLFIYDIARCARLSQASRDRLIERVDGLEYYDQARAEGCGAILVTAHLGSFELGVTALKRREKHIHVVFHQDTKDRFERLRARQRRALGVIEAPVERGLQTWLALREALHADHVVLIQGDRVMPGQDGVKMPFCGGHMMFPTGIVKLAVASGSPIIPVFVIRQPNGKVRICLERSIQVQTPCGRIDAEHPAMIQLAGVIERYVKTYPEQWLVLQPAWCEDQSRGTQESAAQDICV